MSLKYINLFYSNTTFKDVVLSVEHFLRSKNIEVNVTHKIVPTSQALWMLFGVNELPPSTILPKNYIVFQLEQLSVESSKWLTERYIEIMKRSLFVFDYSNKNVFLLRKMGVVNVFYTPIAYTSNMTEYDDTTVSMDTKDIDVLFIGSLNKRRSLILEELKVKGYSVYVADGGVWGEDRTALLRRSKLVLNIHFYSSDAILETVRLAGLMANSCVVVSEPGNCMALQKAFQKGCVFADYGSLVAQTEKYLGSDPAIVEKRKKIARAGFEAIRGFTWNFPINFYRFNSVKEVDGQSTGNQVGDKGVVLKPIGSGDKIEKIPVQIDSDGIPTLIVPEFKDGYVPMVSLITVTKNRKNFIPMSIHQICKLDYPKDRLEWIIVDDSDEFDDFQYICDAIKSQLVGKNKIVYKTFHLSPKNKHTISYKRNYAIENSRGEYIANIDDDDFYFPQSVITKVKYLTNRYPQKRCVGNTELPVYNMMDDTSIITETNHLPEASMVYHRSFWEDCKYAEHVEGEGYPFTVNRRQELLDIPYLFSMVAVNHGKNVTGKTRLFTGSSTKNNKKIQTSGERTTITSLLEAMDEETQEILSSLRGYLKMKEAASMNEEM